MAYTAAHLKFIWICGSFHKLVELGMLENAPMRMTESGWDLYKQIDEERDLISDNDIRAIIENGVRSGDFISSHKDGIISLLKEYKNNRDDVVMYVLECMVK